MSNEEIGFTKMIDSISPRHSAKRVHVSFNDLLTVRCYPTVLGDNPSVRDGPPISLGWKFTTEKLSLTDTTPSSSEPKRNCYLDAPTRIERLLKNGVSQQELDAAYAEIQFVHRLRRINAMILRTSKLSVTNEVEGTKKTPLNKAKVITRRLPERTRSDDALLTTRASRLPPRRTKSNDTLLTTKADDPLRNSLFFFEIFQPLHRVNAAILKRAAFLSKASKGAGHKITGKKPKSRMPPAA